MTNNLITLTIPNDDSTALYHLGKSLIDMSASISGMSEFVVITRDEYDDLTKHVGEMSYKLNIDTSEATAALERLNTAVTKHCHVEVDTTPQQVESLGATHIITEQKLVGDPEPVGDGNFSQGYTATVEEIADPVDSTGTPWDERIHSTSKALNADGTWRLRRKPKDMDEAEWLALVESVKAELTYREQMKEETEQSFDIEQQPVNLDHVSMNDIPEPPVTPPGDDFHTDAGVVTEQTVAGIPPIPVPPPVALPGSTGATDLLPPAPIPTAVTPVDTWDFPKLMKFLTERHGRITVEQVNALLAVDGLAALTDLNAHPDKIGPFVTRVKAHLGE